MCDGVTHEVAAPLQLNMDPFLGEVASGNDDTYREYHRLLRTYFRIAWQHHDCSYCKGWISPGDMYDGSVYVVMKLGEKKRLIVEKKHYPMCPDELTDLEEEVRRRDEQEERKECGTDRKAA